MAGGRNYYNPSTGGQWKLRAIHAAEWQKPTQHCKAIFFQLKINLIFLIINLKNHQGYWMIFLTLIVETEHTVQYFLIGLCAC